MRVLLACQPVPGHLHPNLAVAEALRARGHDVAFYTGSLAAAALQREGFVFYQFQPEMDALISRNIVPTEGVSAAAKTSTDTRGFMRVKQLNAALSEWLLASIPWQVEDLGKIIAEFRPDVLITDVTLLGPILVMREFGVVPVGVFSVLAACSVPGPQAPPWGRGLRPPTSPSSRAAARLEETVLHWLLSGFRHDASRMRTRYGLAPLEGRVADEYAKVPLFMVASAPEFDYMRTDLPACVQYVGACPWTGGAQPAQLPSWMETLGKNGPVVHVTEGTIHTREPMVLRAAAAGLSDLPLTVVMTTGKHRRPDELDLGPIANNVRLEQFVPHQALFARTDVVVTTGGAGTVTTALLAGVPLVVVPTGWDLPENAQRVVECGAGVRLSPKQCTPKKLREAVLVVLNDSSYRTNARRIGDALRRQGGSLKAATLIEGLVNTSSSMDMETAGRSV